MKTYSPIKKEETRNEYLEKTFRDAQYPLEKSEMLELAQLNYADGDILDVLYALGDSNYYCLADIQEEIKYILHDDRVKINDDFLIHSVFDDENKIDESEDGISDDEFDLYRLAMRQNLEARLA
jgi:hypothetical protein